ncbi:MAG: helix-turn-helix domain-containing protein [Vulcanisaeta sp.]
MISPKKVIQVGNTKYYINTPDDARSMIMDLMRQGYTISEISELTGISERWIRRYINNY